MQKIQQFFFVGVQFLGKDCVLILHEMKRAAFAVIAEEPLIHDAYGGRCLDKQRIIWFLGH